MIKKGQIISIRDICGVIPTFDHMKMDCLSDIVLENARVRLSPMTEEAYFQLSPIAFTEEDLLTFSPSSINSPDSLAAYIDKALEQREAGKRYPFVIFDKRSGHYAGSTSYGNISHENLRIEIGWTWIGGGFQRTGLNRNAKFLLLHYAFEHLEWIRVELKTDARNHQSRNAILGIGAQYEGLLRSHTVLEDGFRRDTVYYSILSHEWSGLKNTVFKGMDENQRL